MDDWGRGLMSDKRQTLLKGSEGESIILNEPARKLLPTSSHEN